MIKSIKKRKGFTLIELIIVIAIIGILAAIAVPKYNGIQKDAKIKADIASGKVIADAAVILIGKDELTGTYTADGGAVLDTDMTGYLQNTPGVKLDSTKVFMLKVDDTTDAVTVYAGADEVYPKPVYPYAKADAEE